jgi:hypothetical protein
MALHQQLVHVVANRDAGYGKRYGFATWDSGLVEARLVGAVAELPVSGSRLDALGVSVRARVDAGAVTVEVSGGWAGPVDVLVTLDV